MQNKTTLREIARCCGVSPATVSRVLNGYSYVSEELRNRITDAVTRFDYRYKPNSARQIAILLKGITGAKGTASEQMELFSSMMAAALKEAFAAVSAPVTLYWGNKLEHLKKEQTSLIISLAQPGTVPPRLRNGDTPIIFINGNPEKRGGVFSISSDEEQGMQLAVDYLVRCGHRHIGLLGIGVPSMNAMRSDGFLHAASRHGIRTEVSLVSSNCEYYEQLGKLVSSGITALIAPGEEVGSRVAYMLQLYKLRIPDDLSLLSWETFHISEYWTPRLTTVSQDFRSIAQQCVFTFKNLSHQEKIPENRKIPYQLIERDSVCSRQKDATASNYRR